MIEEKFFNACGTPPRTAKEVIGGKLTYQLAAANLGVGIVPDIKENEETFTVLEDLPFDLEFKAVAAWHEERNNAAIKNFLSLWQRITILHGASITERKSCKSLWYKHFYASNKKVRISYMTRTENLKWGGR